MRNSSYKMEKRAQLGELNNLCILKNRSRKDGGGGEESE